MAKRVQSIDIAKAICIMLVVIGHYNPDTAPMWWKSLNAFIYSFHMPLFLFASGFIYRYTLQPQSKYFHFVGKKLKRLMLPYLITSIIIITIKLLTQGHAQVDNPVTLYTYLEIFYLPAAGFFLWFVWALFWMFLVVHLFKTALARFILFLISIAIFFMPYDLPEIFCLHQFKIMFVFFMGGVMVAESKKIQEWLKSVWGVAYIALFAILLAFIKEGDFATFVIAFAGIATTLVVSRWIQKSRVATSKFFLPIAQASFTIYLFHTTFSGFAKAALNKIPVLNSQFIVGALFVILCGITIPYFLHILISRYKITRLLFGQK